MQQIHLKKNLQSVKFVSVHHMHYSCNQLLLSLLVYEVHIKAGTRLKSSYLGTRENKSIIVLRDSRRLLLFPPSPLTDSPFQQH